MSDRAPFVNVETSIEHAERQDLSGEWRTKQAFVSDLLDRRGSDGITCSELRAVAPTLFLDNRSASAPLSILKSEGKAVQLTAKEERRGGGKEMPYVLTKYVGDRPFDGARVKVKNLVLTEEEFAAAVRFKAALTAAASLSDDQAHLLSVMVKITK